MGNASTATPDHPAATTDAPAVTGEQTPSLAPGHGLAPEHCLNCGVSLAGSFCADCGQRVLPGGRLTTGGIVRQGLDQLFGLESRLGRTVRELTRNPGAVVRAYVSGKRARYVNPFKYCLAMIAAYLLLGAVLGVDPSKTINAGVVGADGNPVAWAEEAQAFVRRNLNNVLFLALPLFAGILRLLYRRSGYNYAETYSFVLFVVGHIFLVGLLLTPFAVWMPGPTLLVRLLFHLVFFVWAARVFYDQKTFGGTARASCAHVLYVLSVMPVAAMFLLFYGLVLKP